jgi:membrane protease subunit HflK
MNYQNPFRREDGSTPDMEKIKKAGRRFAPTIIVIIILIILGTQSIYTLNNGEQAVITRFGKHIATETMPGLKFKMPFADVAYTVNVEDVRRMEFGFRTTDTGFRVVREESLMLTGEEESRSNGLVNADWVIQYRISDSYNYLFKVQNPEETLRTVTQAAYRRVAAYYNLDDIITDNKDRIMREVQQDLQEICDKYEIGINIIGVNLQDATAPEEVRDAFLDVVRAREDRTTKINDANRYYNEQLPLARGEEAAALNSAQAYRDRRVNEALGAVARYNAVLEEYKNQPEIMRTRLYQEMIREVLPKIEKVYFLDQASGNLLGLLHLGQ